MSFSTNSFLGGMNDWIDPRLIASNVAASLVNADVSNGKVVPVRKSVQKDHSDPVYYGHYGTRDRSLVKYFNRYYWSNNTASVSPYYGGNPENFLGMPYPSYSGESPNVTVEGVTPESGVTGLTGNYKYCVTFVSANGWEGAPGSLEEYEVPITLSNQCGKITVSWTDSRISYAKIFRTIGNGADFYNVGEIRTSGTAFTDSVSDSMAQMMNPLDSIDNYPPPDGGKFLTEYGGVFFLAVGSSLYFSKQGNPHAWPTLQFLSVDDTITGIVAEFQGVLVFTMNKVFRITGAEDTSTIVKSYLPGNHGCLSFRSIACVNNAPIWVSSDGLCLWDGESISVINYGRVKVSSPTIKYAVSARDKYFLFMAEDTLVFDRRNGDIFTKINNAFDYAWYNGDTNQLFLKSGNELYEADAGDKMSITYLSPKIGGDTEGIKKFTEFRITVSNPVTVTVNIDDRKKMSVSLPGGRSRVKLGLDFVGEWVQIKAEGVAEISELHVVY